MVCAVIIVASGGTTLHPRLFEEIPNTTHSRFLTSGTRSFIC